MTRGRKAASLKGLQLWHQLISLLILIISEDRERFGQEGLIDLQKTLEYLPIDRREVKSRAMTVPVHSSFELVNRFQFPRTELN